MLNKKNYQEAQKYADEHVYSLNNGMPYQPVGSLLLHFPGHENYRNFYRDLDISTAVATTRYTVGDTTFTREVFSSFEDEVIASVGENAHKDYIIRTVQAQLKTTVSAYRQVNQVLEDQLNAAHITGEYSPGVELNLDGSVAGPKEAQMAVGFLELSHFSDIYESVGLEKAGEFLRSIMTHIHDVIHTHQGQIDKHMK